MPGVMIEALTWSGTFHAIGGRLLREYSHDIRLHRGVAIHRRAASAAERFDRGLIDESQHTTRLHASILLALKPNGKGLTVVGDAAQSIYSFRAATVPNILDFPGHFTPSAEVITLDRNYRSTQPILAAANAVIEQAEERFTKSLWADRPSGERPRLVNVRDEVHLARYIADQ